MKTVPDRFAAASPPHPGTVGVCVVALVLGVASSGVIGCAKFQESEPSPPAMGQNGATDGATAAISLMWDQRDSCVIFVPPTTRLQVGSRVHLNTSTSMNVLVHCPPGLFSASDTTLTVTPGASAESPLVRSTGEYPLSSEPRACAPTTGGAGPSIIVDDGSAAP